MGEIHDLRSYLDVLERNGQLAHVRKPVNLYHEAADVGATVERTGGPAPLFESIYFDDGTGDDGTGDRAGRPYTDWRLFSSALGNQERVALALGCDKSQVTATMARALEPHNAVPPAFTEHAEWKRHAITDSSTIDVCHLPIPKHAVGDGGRFITGGVIVSKHPDTGVGNLGYNRMEILGPHTLGMNINQWRDVQRAHATAEAKGRPLSIAVAIGLDPALMIAAGCKYEGDENNIAGALRGQPVEVTRGVTVEVDTIPAHAELVLEGHVLPGVRREEGPLAEFHGYYGEPWNSPVFEVTAMRVDWGQDIFTVPRAQGHEMDPANDSKGIGAKIGIDATFDKGRRPYGQRVSYPMVELAKYLS